MQQANLILAAIGSYSDHIFARVIDFRSAPLRIYGQPQCASAWLTLAVNSSVRLA